MCRMQVTMPRWALGEGTLLKRWAPRRLALRPIGPAYVKAGGRSARFYFEGTGNKIGTAYFVTFVAPDLSKVRFARYGANFIPRNTRSRTSGLRLNTAGAPIDCHRSKKV